MHCWFESFKFCLRVIAHRVLFLKIVVSCLPLCICASVHWCEVLKIQQFVGRFLSAVGLKCPISVITSGPTLDSVLSLSGDWVSVMCRWFRRLPAQNVYIDDISSLKFHLTISIPSFRSYKLPHFIICTVLSEGLQPMLLQTWLWCMNVRVLGKLMSQNAWLPGKILFRFRKVFRFRLEFETLFHSTRKKQSDSFFSPVSSESIREVCDVRHL